MIGDLAHMLRSRSTLPVRDHASLRVVWRWPALVLAAQGISSLGASPCCSMSTDTLWRPLPPMEWRRPSVVSSRSSLQARGKDRAEQQMIDPEPSVTSVCVSKIIPELINALVRAKRPQRVGPALVNESAVGVPDFRAEQCVVQPALRLLDIKIGRHDDVVCGEDDRRASIKKLFRVGREPPKPT
jgi:hypothetical protein